MSRKKVKKITNIIISNYAPLARRAGARRAGARRPGAAARRPGEAAG